MCPKCNCLKPLHKFSRNSRRKDGVQIYCKKCLKTIIEDYKHTKYGLMSLIYSSQCGSSKRRCAELPKYTRSDLFNWAIKQDKFSILFDNWENSNYKKDLIPSVDRIDDYKSYTIDNIQLMTWEENSIKGHSDQIKGINNKRNKIVLQFDLNDNFIEEYHSLRHASRSTGVNLGDMSYACNGKLKTAGKFIWKYKDNNYEQ